jgi:hypothetical protein
VLGCKGGMWDPPWAFVFVQAHSDDMSAKSPACVHLAAGVL